MQAASLRAFSGSGWTSRNRPSAPAAMAARLSGTDHRALAAAAVALAAGLLNAVRAVEEHGASERLHARDRRHVVDQPMIAERRSPLGQQQPVVAGGAGLGADLAHVLRREELRLLDVERLSGARGGDDEVGLAAEERRDSAARRAPARRARTARAGGRRSAPAARSGGAPPRASAGPRPGPARERRRRRCGSPCRRRP